MDVEFQVFAFPFAFAVGGLGMLSIVSGLSLYCCKFVNSIGQSIGCVLGPG